MSAYSLSITLAIVGVTCAIAVLLARRWQLHLVPAWIASGAWSAGCLVAYWFIMSRWPPLPWTAAAFDSQPWESVVVPLLAVNLIWPLWAHCIVKWANVRLMSGMILSCLPLLASLCQAERYAEYYLGNTAWSLAALLSIGINCLAMERLEDRGAGRWCLWILVGQSLTIAALIMTCYGRFGEWAMFTGMTLGVIAVARMCVANSLAKWSSALALPVLTLNAVLVMHIREYRTVPLPIWFPALPFLLPVLVATGDWAWAGRLRPVLRVIVAAVLTAALGAATIAIVLALNGPAEEW